MENLLLFLILLGCITFAILVTYILSFFIKMDIKRKIENPKLNNKNDNLSDLSFININKKEKEEEKNSEKNYWETQTKGVYKSSDYKLTKVRKITS